MLSEEVKVNLYNLPWLCGANHVLEPFGYGAYHVAVEAKWKLVLDLHNFPLHPCTGIWQCRPGAKGRPAHAFVFKTPLSRSEIRQLLRQMQFEWRADDYCIIRQNCIHFSAAFCERLHVGPFPSWALALPTALHWLPDAMGGALVAIQRRHAQARSEASRYEVLKCYQFAERVSASPPRADLLD
ncbi:unnamed protein product [Symbiodinium sp. CCMP2592]|nr:unnamed protein product [Symbiodinium sp. CCMP2592]